VILNLKPVNSDAIKRLLMEKHNIPDYKAEIAARFSGGNIGKAIRYAVSEDFEHKKEDVLHILRYIDEMELSEVLAGLKVLSGNRASIEEYLDFMLLWYRDVLMLKATNDPNLLLYKSDYQFIKKQAGLRSYEEIENIIAAIEKAKIRLKANVNFDIAIELMLLKIKERRNG
jgi:DNA polymerase-3 subunit delta'